MKEKCRYCGIEAAFQFGNRCRCAACGKQLVIVAACPKCDSANIMRVGHYDYRCNNCNKVWSVIYEEE